MLMKKFISGLILLFVLQSTDAQTFNPQLANMLQDTLNKYNALITNIKGMSASVYIPGQGIWKGCAGVSYAGQPITTDMEFGIASNTKLFVATTMLILQENNILDLDDSLSKWLPVYPNINPNITIRQLLNHTAGVQDPIFLAPWMDTIKNNPTRVFTPNEVLSWVGPPVFPAGTGWSYSNVNYILAGMIAENATGYHISQLIRDSILTPLNLDSTFYDVEEAETGTIAHRWFNTIDYNDTSRVGLNTAAGCAGALFSTSGEMAQWYHALMNGQVLDSASFADLTSFVATGGPYTYGLALENQVFFGHTLWGHGGATWGYRSKVFYDPCMDIVAFGIANSYPAGSDGVVLLLYKTVVEYLPECAGAILGESNVCQGQDSVTYTVPLIPKATSYTWILPAGVTGTSNTNTITVDFGLTAVSSEISVKGTNNYGDGGKSSIAVNVTNKPTTPVITQFCNDLHSDAPLGNQWYDINGPISGATNQVFNVLLDGDYYVVVSLSGCSSDTSNHIYVNLTGIDRIESDLIFSLYPNPARNNICQNIYSDRSGIASMNVYDMYGEMVFSNDKIGIQQGVNFTSYDFPAGLKSGIYFIVTSFENKTNNYKLIILK
jgi:D-alanyl-D-alanine carboxypeptidase